MGSLPALCPRWCRILFAFVCLNIFIERQTFHTTSPRTHTSMRIYDKATLIRTTLVYSQPSYHHRTCKRLKKFTYSHLRAASGVTRLNKALADYFYICADRIYFTHSLLSSPFIRHSEYHTSKRTIYPRVS